MSDKMTKYKIHIDEPLPNDATINKYKNFAYKQAQPRKWYRFESIAKLLKNKKVLAIIIMILATILACWL